MKIIAILLATLPPFLVGVQEVVDVLPGFDWGTISATGLLGWYLWYTTKVVFPNHQKQVSEMQEKFTTQFNSQRDHYEKILDDLQDRYDAKNEIEAQRMQRVSDTLDKINMTLNKIGEKQ